MTREQDLEVYTIKELVGKGYGLNELRRICRSEDFWQVGHKEGTVYKINLQKLEKYLERRTKWQS